MSPMSFLLSHRERGGSRAAIGPASGMRYQHSSTSRIRVQIGPDLPRFLVSEPLSEPFHPFASVRAVPRLDLEATPQHLGRLEVLDTRCRGLGALDHSSATTPDRTLTDDGVGPGRVAGFDELHPAPPTRDRSSLSQAVHLPSTQVSTSTQASQLWITAVVTHAAWVTDQWRIDGCLEEPVRHIVVTAIGKSRRSCRSALPLTKSCVR
jgi:hypothetical protein